MKAFVALAGISLTLGLAMLTLLFPYRYDDMDGGVYLAVFALGLLVTLAGIQLGTPTRRTR